MVYKNIVDNCPYPLFLMKLLLVTGHVRIGHGGLGSNENIVRSHPCISPMKILLVLIPSFS